MDEEWRSIPGYEGLYEASNLGRCRSVDRWVPSRRSGYDKVFKKGCVLSSVIGVGGYRQYSLCKDGEPKCRKAHALVASAFLGPRPHGLLVLHGDGNPLNNTPGNVRYGTSKDNQDDSKIHGTRFRGERVNTAKVCPDRVRLIRAMCRGGARQERLAEMFGINNSNISAIAGGRTWAHVA